MSTSEEEQGSLVLPSAAVVPFRRAMVKAMNDYQAKVLMAAEKVYAYLDAEVIQPGGGPKKVRMAALRKALRQPGYQARRAAEDQLWSAIAAIDGDDRSWQRNWGNDVRQAVVELLLPYPKADEPLRLRRPRKAHLPTLPQGTLVFGNGEASVSIKPDTRQVRWRVSENNHAVDRAWESTLGQAFKAALATITWTRGTGGVFRKSDEYARDAAIEHGGNAVSISHHFGPLGEQEYEGHHGYNPRTMKMAGRRLR